VDVDGAGGRRSAPRLRRSGGRQPRLMLVSGRVAVTTFSRSSVSSFPPAARSSLCTTPRVAEQ
jgi:hypothetical protein